MLEFALLRELHYYMSCNITEDRKVFTNNYFLLRAMNSTSIECISGALADRIVASVQITIDNATVTGEGVTFEYKEDPTFDRLAPAMTIPS